MEGAQIPLIRISQRKELRACGSNAMIVGDNRHQLLIFASAECLSTNLWKFCCWLKRCRISPTKYPLLKSVSKLPISELSCSSSFIHASSRDDMLEAQRAHGPPSWLPVPCVHLLSLRLLSQRVYVFPMSRYYVSSVLSGIERAMNSMFELGDVA